jgi:hypothetical protein
MPLQNQIHVDSLLSQISVKYRNLNYIAMDLFPEVAVRKSSDLYRVYQRNFRIPETERSTKAAAREHDFDVSNTSYLLRRNSLKSYVSDNDADNYDLADLRSETVEELTEVLLRKVEKDAALLATTTSWSLNLSLAATAAWDATTTVDPVAHFDTGTSQVVLNSGMRPNCAGMGLQAWHAFKNNAQVLDRIKHTSREVGMNLAAALIGADKVLVALGSEDTSNLGASESIAALWNDAVFWGYAPSSPGPLKQSAGYTFRKSMPMVKRYRVEDRESDAIEVNMEYQIKVVSSLSGFIIKDVI